MAVVQTTLLAVQLIKSAFFLLIIGVDLSTPSSPVYACAGRQAKGNVKADPIVLVVGGTQGSFPPVVHSVLHSYDGARRGDGSLHKAAAFVGARPTFRCTVSRPGSGDSANVAAIARRLHTPRHVVAW